MAARGRTKTKRIGSKSSASKRTGPAPDRPDTSRSDPARPDPARTNPAENDPANKGQAGVSKDLSSPLITSVTVIEKVCDIERGIVALAACCPHMAAATRVSGSPPLRRWSAGFDGLVRIVVGQQLSVASANAILARLAATVDPLDATGIVTADERALRAAGLSAGKIATLRALASAVETGAIGFDTLGVAPPETVHRELTSIRGIGPWTADIWLVLCRGDADAFAAGDLALQEAARSLMNLDSRPTSKELLQIAERWRPWRGVAARVLWAWHAHVKSRRDASGQPKRARSEETGRQRRGKAPATEAAQAVPRRSK